MEVTSLTLAQYPQSIANAQTTLQAIVRDIAGIQLDLVAVDCEIEREVQSDLTMTNDAKRKAKRVELQQEHDEHKRLSSWLQTMYVSRDAAEVELQFLLNSFSVLKLEMRYKVAEMQMAATVASF